MPTNIDDKELARLEELAKEVPFSGNWYDTITGEGRPCVNASRPHDYHGNIICVQAKQGFDIKGVMPYISAACNAAPALVAEVRMLLKDRDAMLRDMDAVKTKAEPCDDCWTIYMLMREIGIKEKNWFHRDVCKRIRTMQNAEQENAALREKLEAWEWLHEVEWLFRHFVDRKSYWRVRSDAFDELAKTLIVAREAVHADRE